jgi:hypothetical protein
VHGRCRGQCLRELGAPVSSRRAGFGTAQGKDRLGHIGGGARGRPSEAFHSSFGTALWVQGNGDGQLPGGGTVGSAQGRSERRPASPISPLPPATLP